MNSICLYKYDFPLDFIKHVARCNCHCQNNALEVDQNYHIGSCMVGMAQQYLEVKEQLGHIGNPCRRLE